MQHPVAAAPIPERVRTLAAMAAPTHVSIAEADLPACQARGGVDAQGRPVLLVKPGEALYGSAPETVVTVDLVATRVVAGGEKARGLLKVRGWTQTVPEDELRDTAIAIAESCPDEDLFTALEGGAPRLVRVDVAHVVYLTGQESGLLDAEEYLDARPDPFLHAAERMIRHINEAHRDQLAQATAVLMGEPAADAWLWELDRYGATIKSAAPGAEPAAAEDRFVRLPWPIPAASPQALEYALRCLLFPRPHDHARGR
ncbi:DUF2470 domain-containing protein [Planotetraspora phitsanulokensis]|uniref:DUF2470 domain-containing protein n=1 Tax=Planotetraspora phitsanulokensis TaxID=575192 RepID=A0A8J3XHM6_9ACTN|nr:DUF2470 domain-containing protein [Planotetraspora phitsanulokensis]GII42142.1 hypothetical protein Pph01_71450 [Planotetraspora phitsanulokensis]